MSDTAGGDLRSARETWAGPAEAMCGDMAGRSGVLCDGWRAGRDVDEYG